jgi:hypothetical protein
MSRLSLLQADHAQLPEANFTASLRFTELTEFLECSSVRCTSSKLLGPRGRFSGLKLTEKSDIYGGADGTRTRNVRS